MQRHSGGLAVPKQMLDVFLGKEAIAGQITCVLTYAPKSLNDIVIPPVLGLSHSRYVFFAPNTLTGKSLLIDVTEHVYDKTSNTTDTTGAAGGGATPEPHSHYVGYDATQLMAVAVADDLDPVKIHYTVA